MEVSTTLITMIVLHLKYIPLKQSLTCTFTLWRGVCVCVYIYTYIIINNASQRACGSLGSEVTFAFTAHGVGDLQLFFPNNTSICILSPHTLLYNILVCQHSAVTFHFYSEY